MKPYITTATIVIATLFLGTSVLAQEYQDELDPVYLLKNTKVVSYQKVHTDLIEKETFRFGAEIRGARKSQTTVSFLAENENAILPKEAYLKTLKKAGNSAENANDFHVYLMEHIESFPISNQDAAQLIDLYKVVRANTFEGKLDRVGNALTWL